MTTRKDFPSRKKARRETALYNLERRLKGYKNGKKFEFGFNPTIVKNEIAILKERIKGDV